MGILDIAVDLANKVTKSLKFQADVTYERKRSVDGQGTVIYDTPVTLPAIVDYASHQVRTRDGTLTVTRATIEILDEAKLAAATGGEGIGNDDRFTLPDGDTGPILDIGGFMNPGTSRPIPTRVMLG